MNARRHRSETFADILSEVEETPTRQVRVGWSSPLGDREWHDEAGVSWHMRGQPLDEKQLRRVLERPGVRVLLFDNGDPPYQVSGAERDELVARIEESFSARTRPESDFLLADLRNDQGDVMLIVDETCC